MRIEIDVLMDYQLTGDETVLLTLQAAQTQGQIIRDSALEIQNATLQHIGGEDGIGQRIWASIGTEQLNLHYRASVDVTRPEVRLDTLPATPLPLLPDGVISYLRPSRFCQSDLFSSFVVQQFGHLEGGAKIAAIADWIAREISYVSGSSNATTTAIDSFVARAGVCRDYAHLVCSLARAAHIPARYTSVYGVDVHPADFHAVAEVWLNGAWHLVDATGMGSADSLVVIGVGRDAGDVAFMETQKWANANFQSIDVRQG